MLFRSTQFSNETLELALAHTIKNKAEAAYRRQDQLEKRTALMRQWEQYLDTKPVNGEVITLRKDVK